MTRTPDILVLRGAAVTPWLPQVAALRIAVFRDFPYLYAGDPDYEARYLAVYARSPDSVFVLAVDGERLVGASTGIPLSDDQAAFQQPFVARGMPVDEVFYCGESVLLADYRGSGLGHRFFNEREAHARRLGRFRWIAFAAVDRDREDPRRPPDHRDHDAFWRKRGYAPQSDMRMRLAWRELGEAGESDHSLTFWLRRL